MIYCELHKDLTEEESDDCPLCLCMREKAQIILKYGERIKTLESFVRDVAEVLLFYAERGGGRAKDLYKSVLVQEILNKAACYEVKF